MRIVDQMGIKVKRRKDRLATEAGAQRNSSKTGQEKDQYREPRSRSTEDTERTMAKRATR
jgi:hypothetical protein